MNPNDPYPTFHEAQGGGRRERAFTVSELSGRIQRLLETGIGRVRVEGEISNLRRPKSGHAYFALKDADCSINCVCFRSRFEAIRIPMVDGMKIEVSGMVSAYTARGEYQIQVDSAREAGLGDLMRRFMELRDRLQAEGLFAAERKKPIPRYPRAIGLVTSITGAAIRDILHVLLRRAGGVRIYVAPCAVQGDAAPGEIRRALKLLERHGKSDVVIVARGGGSIEDLWAFNDERVVRAIASFPIPVVSGIGHEIDTTLSDFVADLRAATPSAAAERVTASYEDALGRLRALEGVLDRAIRHKTNEARARLNAAANAWGMRRPLDKMATAVQRVDELHQRLDRAGLRRITRAKDDLRRGLDNLQKFSWERRFEPLKLRIARMGVELSRAVARRIEVARRDAERARQRLAGVSPAARALRARERFETISARLAAARPDARWAPRLRFQREMLAQWDSRVDRAARARVDAARDRLKALEARLQSVNPEAVLQRGYSVVMKQPGGRVITAPDQVRTGQVVRVRSAGGEWKAQALPNVDELFDTL